MKYEPDCINSHPMVLGCWIKKYAGYMIAYPDKGSIAQFIYKREDRGYKNNETNEKEWNETWVFCPNCGKKAKQIK